MNPNGQFVVDKGENLKYGEKHENNRTASCGRITLSGDSTRYMYWDAHHPYRWRTWLRAKLPWFLVDLGFADKAEDCEKIGAEHWWYNQDGEHSACYHCKIVRRGRLWRDAA